MKVLIMSDSHSALSFMRLAVQAVKPDCIVHLGDYVRDGDIISEENSGIPFYQLPGNCDLYRLERPMQEIQVRRVGGAMLYMTHGHRHGVKTFLGKLISDASAAGAQAVLFGHTHEAYCAQEDDGLWVMNPGSCGFYGGSVGLMEINSGMIQSCRILRQDDLEEML